MFLLIAIVTTLFFLVLVYSFFYFLKLYYKANEDFIVKLSKVQFDNERNLVVMQMEIKEETFENISREIHDNIGQKLSLAKLHLCTAGVILNPSQNDKILAAINLMTGSIIELSDMSRTMNSDYIAHHGLCKIIEMETVQLEKLCRYTIHFSVSGERVFFTPYQELISFRIFQEAISNVIKHSECSTIKININFMKRGMELIIADDGKGFNTELPHISFGAGILNMAKRASLINATLKIKSSMPHGTLVHMQLLKKENIEN